MYAKINNESKNIMFKKINKSFVLGLLSIAIFFILLGIFGVDVGINSKYFIKKDFTNAFIYRVTGDCGSFGEYINHDIEKWKDTCEKEKSNENPGIRYFKIQNISHRFDSNRAFLQIELTRRSTTKNEDYVYSVNYEMRKIGLRWKIDQDKK